MDWWTEWQGLQSDDNCSLNNQMPTRYQAIFIRQTRNIFKSCDLDKVIGSTINIYSNVATGTSEPFEINVPFQTIRGRDTSIIIKSGKQDLFDMSPEDTKRLVQGIVWRDEHFNGTYICDIAKRENCSSRYCDK